MKIISAYVLHFFFQVHLGHSNNETNTFSKNNSILVILL